MNGDPGLFTDSTGEGMAGAEDVRQDTQEALKTVYNGSRECPACGGVMNPVESLHSMQVCPISHVKVLPKSSKSKFVYGDMTQSDVDEFESKINPGLKKGHPNWESIQDYAERKRPAE